jgi:hypothetical protein
MFLFPKQSKSLLGAINQFLPDKRALAGCGRKARYKGKGRLIVNEESSL